LDYGMKTATLCARLGVIVSLGVASHTASAAVVEYTETFDTNASGWLNGVSAAPTYNATGGVGNSGYIAYTTSFTSGTAGSFGAPPLQVLFRGNDAANASGDAFVGNWLTAGVQSFSVTVRHNYTSTLNLYARFDAGFGAGASLAADPAYAIAPNTWTTITVPITDSNPPFSSYGAGSFSSVFANVQNVQLGLYVPPSTTFTDLRMDLDNVKVAIPEPTSVGLLAGGAGMLMFRRRRNAR
jgi:hypothetical protein